MKKSSERESLVHRAHLLAVQSQRSLDYINSNGGPGEGGGTADTTRHHSQWTNSELKTALEAAGISTKKMKNKTELLAAYESLLADENTDHDRLDMIHEEVVAEDEQDAAQPDTNASTISSIESNEATSISVNNIVAAGNNVADNNEELQDESDDRNYFVRS